MEFNIDIGKRLAWPLILVLILIFISMQLNGLALEPNVNAGYVEFYQNTLSIAGWAVLALVVFNLHRETHIGEILGIGTWQKALLFFGFFAFIMLLTIGAGQIVPVPRASAQPLQLNSETEVFITSSLIPAFTEDAVYLIAFPAIILTILLVVIEQLFGDVGRPEAIGAVVLACLIASTGFNIWVIPGFTSAHVPAYGEVQEAYLGAWIFSFGQSMVYMFTGWFAPITHFAHNAFIAAGEQYQISIGGFQVVG